MNLNFSPPPFSMEQMKDNEYDPQQQQQAFNFGLNHQIVSSSSSSSASCRIFFNPSEDHMGFYHPQDDYYGYRRGSSSYEIESKVENGLKLTLWKKEDEGPKRNILVKDCDDVKWISSKMKHVAPPAKIEVKKVMPSSSVETDLSSSYNCNSNTPIRVCSDCHTTKTPLWRSGPKGPKSLCNACGIRQRKARRAMAAAANGGGGVASSPPCATKVRENIGKSEHDSQLKKRCKVAAGSSSSRGKKMDNFEDFLINLSNKLASHRVFPQDETEAAILLMAISSGLVHG